jgi:hypothetical protein
MTAAATAGHGVCEVIFRKLGAELAMALKLTAADACVTKGFSCEQGAAAPGG